MEFINLEKKLEKFIKTKMVKDAAHDISHIKRVVKSGKEIAISMNANLYVVIPACWLHDCINVDKSSDKRNLGSKLSAEAAIEFLKEIGYPENYYKEIYHAIESHSFSANVETKTLEAEIVQDADRLDALGAIGVSRCLMYSASKGRQLYVASDPFGNEREFDDSKSAIDHFYTKLEKLPLTMKTESGKKMAEERWKFMENFIEQLKIEVN